MILSPVSGRIFILVTGLGIVGNIFIFVNYTCIIGGTEKTSIHLILIHLAFTNIIILLSKAMQKTIAAFGLRNFLGDVGCKILIYLGRMSRGLSICTTCLLTVVQAITISPRASRWRRIKLKSSWHILSLFLFFWILSSLISMNLPLYIKNISSMNTSLIKKSDSYCYFVPGSWILRWVFLALMVLRDALFQGVMGGASGYMVFLLHQHHQQVLYLQNSRVLYKTPPELKAAQSVLFLMFCFLFFYWIDCFISLYSTFTLKIDFIALIIQEFLTIGYATVSPFVLIHRDGRLTKCWYSLSKRLRH